jgi:hypothetical protein
MNNNYGLYVHGRRRRCDFLNTRRIKMDSPDLTFLRDKKRDFRSWARRQKIEIEEQRVEFEKLCVTEGLKATSIAEVSDVLAFMYTNSNASDPLYRKWFTLCVVPQEVAELLNSTVFQRKGGVWWETLRRDAFKVLFNMVQTALRAPKTKEDLEKLREIFEFLGSYDAKKWCEAEMPCFIALYELWSMMLSSLCSNSDNLIEYRSCLEWRIFESRYRLLYKQEYGHSPRSDWAGRRWSFL